MIFVDTSFWAALTRKRDRLHPDAVELLRRAAGRELVTTNRVVGEAWTFVRGREHHRTCVQFVERLRASRFGSGVSRFGREHDLELEHAFSE